MKERIPAFLAANLAYYRKTHVPPNVPPNKK